jgi:hypothetical protein
MRIPDLTSSAPDRPLLAAGWPPGLHALVLAVVLAVAAGCAPFVPPAPVGPRFASGIQTREEGTVRVDVAVLSDEEIQHHFGVPAGARDIQPVWIRIENRGSDTVYLLQRDLDPDYFSPAEAAYRNRSWFAGARNRAMRAHFERHAVPRFIRAGETVSGFVFATRDEGLKAVTVTILGERWSKEFRFTVPIPGARIDYEQVDFARLYREAELVALEDEAAFRAALAALPCCAMDRHGRPQGDPLNLVLVGDRLVVLSALVRMGWDVTEALDAATAWKTFTAFVLQTRYRYSPVSPLYLFGRRHDMALQKARETIDQRNHLRLWLSPLRHRGHPVWVGQVSRDIGVYFTLRTWNLTTHAIDPDVDETREYLGEDLLRSGLVHRMGYVGGVGPAPPSEPRQNLLGDPYYTDGLRAVFVLTDEPTAVDEVGFLDWEWPPE